MACACSSIAPKTNNKDSSAFFASKLKKVCIEGAGKGRIELIDSKYTFAYESQINRNRKLFELALDFPIIGETKVELSLNPKTVSKQIGNSELVEVLQERIGDRADRDELIKTIKEFFVFASDFIRHKASNVYPAHFSATFENEHFILNRITPHYKFQVDNFSENPTYFERTVFKIFQTSTPNSTPVLTLFLVPDSCDK